jgi:hypothetical protein
MNFAEGRGPKTSKKPYVLGQFVTLYGNGNPSVNLNPAPVPYPSQVSGTGSATTWNGGTAGSVVPGLNLSSSVNSNTDVGFVCSPGSQESVQDLENTVATLNAEAGWTGSATVRLQATADRYTGTTSYTSTNWVTLATTTVSSGNTPYILQVSGGVLYNAYRLTASGGTGIIDWAIAGMFTDFSAMGIGNNATDANGGIGQLNIANPRVNTISGSAIQTVAEPVPYENTKANHTFIG